MTPAVITILIGALPTALGFVEKAIGTKDENDSKKKKRSWWFIGIGFAIMLIGVVWQIFFNDSGKPNYAPNKSDTIPMLRAIVKHDTVKPSGTPDVVIKELVGRYNPKIWAGNGDSLHIATVFENCGTAPAVALHTKSFNLVMDDTSVINVNPSDNASYLNDEEIIKPDCNVYGYTNAIHVFWRNRQPNFWIVDVIAYCYKDTTGYIYPVRHKIYKWQANKLDTFAVIGNETDRKIIKRVLTASGKWPEKPF